MNEVIEVLEFVKKTYKNRDVIRQIDNSIEILKGNGGLKSRKVINMIKALKVAYDDENMKVKFDEAIKILEAA